MAKKKESKLQRQIRRDIEREIGGVWYKTHGGAFQEPGLGDLMGCVQGYHIEVEVKTDDGDLRQTQRLRMRRIIDEGGAYIIARSSEEAIFKIARWLKRHGKIAKNVAHALSNSSSDIRLPEKARRIVHATENSKVFYNLSRPRKVVAIRRAQTSRH